MSHPKQVVKRPAPSGKKVSGAAILSALKSRVAARDENLRKRLPPKR